MVHNPFTRRVALARRINPTLSRIRNLSLRQRREISDQVYGDIYGQQRLQSMLELRRQQLRRRLTPLVSRRSRSILNRNIILRNRMYRRNIDLASNRRIPLSVVNRICSYV
jgi:hypothetical protein